MNPVERIAIAPAAGERLVIVSNRLPVRRVMRRDGAQSWQLSPGGLVSALQPIFARRGGTWVGWLGDATTARERSIDHDSMHLQPVSISTAELADYYDGFCNRSIWPLYHDSLRLPAYRREWWDAYVRLNRRFADAAIAQAGSDDVIWVHDYQLQLVPGMIRARVPNARIGFYLHIPFPPLELMAQLPWRRELLEGLLGADLIGFQTRDAARNFQRAARHLAMARPGIRHSSLSWNRRSVELGVFPISIDVERFEELARNPEVRADAERIRAAAGGRKLLLGVDRLDYTKGVDHRLEAFAALLARGRGAEELAMIQIAVPTRHRVPEYATLARRIEQMAARINEEFGGGEREPVQWIAENLPPHALVAHYLAADVLVVTPLRDGMNLVAKEFVASRLDHSGRLVLSEFAGAAQGLRHAVLVNPHDLESLANAMERAVSMDPAEAGWRMRVMREYVRRHDVDAWADAFLRTLARATGERRARQLQARRKAIAPAAASEGRTIRVLRRVGQVAPAANW